MSPLIGVPAKMERNFARVVVARDAAEVRKDIFVATLFSHCSTVKFVTWWTWWKSPRTCTCGTNVCTRSSISVPEETKDMSANVSVVCYVLERWMKSQSKKVTVSFDE